jgi:hypothetical protein
MRICNRISQFNYTGNPFFTNIMMNLQYYVVVIATTIRHYGDRTIILRISLSGSTNHPLVNDVLEYLSGIHCSTFHQERD